jgi:hypothetical protein
VHHFLFRLGVELQLIGEVDILRLVLVLRRLRYPSQPGTVWAIDSACPPLPLEAGYTDLPAVSDLASGMPLLWLPVAKATAATMTAVLSSVFILY